MENKIEKTNCKKSELRDVTISVRVTKGMSKFMADNEFSPSRIMIEALKMLGFKE
jgi:hypothetical protein